MMADVLYFNGRFTTTDEPVLTVEDRGFQFGDSLYEVMRFIDGKPRFGRAHWERLSRGLRFIDLRSPWDSWDQFDTTLRQVLERTDFTEGILYVQVTRGTCERVHFYPEDLDPTVVVYSRRFDFPDDRQKEQGTGVVSYTDLRWKHCDVKSVNLLPNVLAKRAAKVANAGEALLIEDGFVIEGASSNFFAVMQGRVQTHPSNEQILPGVVRDRVISLALAERIRVDERPIRENELFSIDEAFLTSTTLGVMPVVSIDGRQVGDGRRGPVTETLQRRLDELEHSEDAVDAVRDQGPGAGDQGLGTRD
jgi:D-alanine transaminase